MRLYVNATYMNLETGDEQEVGVIENWEFSSESEEKMKEWRDMFRPELTEGEIDQLWGLIKDFSEDSKHPSYEKAVELLRPKVTMLKDTLQEMEMDYMADPNKWRVEQNQM